MVKAPDGGKDGKLCWGELSSVVGHKNRFELPYDGPWCDWGNACNLYVVAVIVWYDKEGMPVHVAVVSSHFGPGSYCKIVLLDWLLALLTMVGHADIALGDVFRQLRCHTWPVETIACSPDAGFYSDNMKSACLAHFFIFSWSRVQNWDNITHSAASLGSRPFPIRNSIILKLTSSERGLIQKQSLGTSGHSFQGKKASPLITLNSFVLLSTTSCKVK